MFRFVLVVSVLLIALIAHPQPPGAAGAPDLSSDLERCSVVLVPNELLTKHSNNTDEAFFDAVCGDWYNSHNNVVDSRLGVSAVIKAIPVSLDAGNTTTTTSLSRTQYCSQTNRRVSTETKDMFWSSVVPDEARAAWLSCVKTVTNHAAGQPHPINIKTQTTGDQQVALSVLFNANVGGEQPRFERIEATNMSCADNTGGSRPLIPSQGDGLAFICRWASPSESAGFVIVHTTRGAEIATAERILPPYLKIAQELHTPVTRIVRTATVCGGWFGTTDMHNWKKDGNGDGRCTKASDDGKWCKGNYGQTVTAQSGGQLRNPRFECQGGACEWNNIPGHQFWATPTSGVTSITGETWAGSRSVQLRLCADEDVPGTEDQVVSNFASWILARRDGFVVEVPNGSRAVLNIRLNGGSTSALEAGKSNNILSVMGRTAVGNVTKWSYIVN